MGFCQYSVMLQIGLENVKFSIIFEIANFQLYLMLTAASDCNVKIEQLKLITIFRMISDILSVDLYALLCSYIQWTYASIKVNELDYVSLRKIMIKITRVEF